MKLARKKIKLYLSTSLAAVNHLNSYSVQALLSYLIESTNLTFFM